MDISRIPAYRNSLLPLSNLWLAPPRSISILKQTLGNERDTFSHFLSVAVFLDALASLEEVFGTHSLNHSLTVTETYQKD